MFEGPLWSRAQDAAKLLRDAPKVLVAHHIDADGVTSGAIAMEALQRAGIPAEAQPCRSMDELHVKLLQEHEAPALWFCDLGSTVFEHFPQPKVICDHHELVRTGTEDFPGHVNPLLDELPGDSISGAGCAFLVAMALSRDNLDLLPLGLVGATGDLQDRGGWEGMNAHFVDLGLQHGLLEKRIDLGFYGPTIRPLTKFLAYAREALVPGIQSQKHAREWLTQLGIDVADAQGERTWDRLTPQERSLLGNAILERHLDAGSPPEVLEKLVRPVTLIAGEPEDAMTRELQAYGTLLNSTARYDRSEVGLAVARGDRDEMLGQAMELILDHRKHLMTSVAEVQLLGLERSAATQWVDVGTKVRDTVIGIVLGMCMDAMNVDPSRPVLGFAQTPDGRLKVSSRAPAALQGKVDLATAMRLGAEAFGGQGGGHAGAAGATIPAGQRDAFLQVVDEELLRQGIS